MIISRMLIYMVSPVSLCRRLVDQLWKISGGTGTTGPGGLPVGFSTEK